MYRSHVHIIPEQSGIKQAYVDPFPQPIPGGFHGDLKTWDKAPVTEDLPSLLDYLVVAIASCLTGTLAEALEARRIPAHDGTFRYGAPGLAPWWRW
jgi:hypothetical protein